VYTGCNHASRFLLTVHGTSFSDEEENALFDKLDEANRTREREFAAAVRTHA